jgi:hypothetical protein
MHPSSQDISDFADRTVTRPGVISGMNRILAPRRYLSSVKNGLSFSGLVNASSIAEDGGVTVLQRIFEAAGGVGIGLIGTIVVGFGKEQAS